MYSECGLVTSFLGSRRIYLVWRRWQQRQLWQYLGRRQCDEAASRMSEGQEGETCALEGRKCNLQRKSIVLYHQSYIHSTSESFRQHYSRKRKPSARNILRCQRTSLASSAAQQTKLSASPSPLALVHANQLGSPRLHSRTHSHTRPATQQVAMVVPGLDAHSLPSAAASVPDDAASQLMKLAAVTGWGYCRMSNQGCLSRWRRSLRRKES